MWGELLEGDVLQWALMTVETILGCAACVANLVVL